MTAKNFTELRVWQVAHQVTLEIYKFTRRLPVEERYDLSSQMRRAAVSIAANIAEGFGRWAPKDRARFYEISKSSAEELRYYLILTRDLGYLKADPGLDERIDSVCRMLYRLRQVVLTGPAS